MHGATLFNPAAQCMQCPCHGSQYHLDGTVRRGPANFPLRSFHVRYDGTEFLSIELPDVSFGLEVVQVQPDAGRLRLRFIAFDQIQYEVLFRPSANAEWTGPLPFSLAVDGPLTETSLVGAADYADIYVERTAGAGFFGVAMRVEAV
jgi:hypothetical protein